MEGLRSICIVHRKEEDIFASYIKEFVNWIGLEYFDFVYRENENLDSIFKNDYFDIILYIGLNKKNVQLWKEKFSSFGEINISMEIEDFCENFILTEEFLQELLKQHGESFKKLWEQNKENFENLWKKYKKDSLQKLWKQYFEKIEKENENFQKIANIFLEIVDIYNRYDLFRNLFDHRLTIITTENKNEQYKSQVEMWKEVIEKLEEIEKKKIDSNSFYGLEYLEYAICSSRCKINEICNLLNARMFFPTNFLLQSTEQINDLDENFYMVEYLKSKIARIDPMYKISAFSFTRKCIDACRTDICKSFYYFKLGKLHEIFHNKEKAMKCFKLSNQKNPLNFRAIFKLAADNMKKQNYTKAKICLQKIMEIFQLNVADKESYEKQLKLLSPLELEYVCKCNILLGNIIEVRFYGNMSIMWNYYEVANGILNYIDENLLLRIMYPENKIYENVQNVLKRLLSHNSIQEKLKNNKIIEEKINGTSQKEVF